MPVTSNGWESFYPELIERIKSIFRSNEPEIISNANDNPQTVLPLSQEDQATIKSEYETTVDSTIEKTVEDINDELDEDGTDVDDSTIMQAKVVGAFFVINAVNRAYERLHGATIARQAQDDVAQAQKEAIEASENQIDLITRNELGETYTQSAREQQLAKGVSRYRWVHSGAEHPRQNHVSHDGQIFSWDAPPDSDGFPGEAFNCSCYAVPVVDEIQNKQGSKTMNNKVFNLKLNGNVAELYIQGIIGDYDIFNDEGVVFNEFVKEIDEAVTSEKVKIFVNSPGGYAYDGIAIYNKIKALSQANDIEIHISGRAASVASIVALSVPIEKRFIHPGSIMMIHNPFKCVCGESKDMRSVIDELDTLTNAVAQIYADETSLSLEEAKKMMGAETYFSETEAQLYGFANIVTGDQPQQSANKSEIQAFLDQVKTTCTVEQKDQKQISAKYKKLFNPINQVSQMDLKELQDKLEAEKKEKAQLQAKLEADQSTLEKLKAENKEIQVKLEAAEAQIESAPAQALEQAKADLKNASEAMNKAKDAGFENIEGDTVQDIQRAVLAQANVSKPDSFEGEALDSIFNHVIENNKKDDEHEKALEPKNQSKDSSEKLTRRNRRGAK